MPTLTGLQTLEALSEQKCLDPMPPVVVFSTEATGGALRDQYMAHAGVQGCVGKDPTAHREVLALIHTALRAPE